MNQMIRNQNQMLEQMNQMSAKFHEGIPDRRIPPNPLTTDMRVPENMERHHLPAEPVGVHATTVMPQPVEAGPSEPVEEPQTPLAVKFDRVKIEPPMEAMPYEFEKLESLKKDTLKTYARSLGVKGYSDKNKDDLISLIENTRQYQDWFIRNHNQPSTDSDKEMDFTKPVFKSNTRKGKETD